MFTQDYKEAEAKALNARAGASRGGLAANVWIELRGPIGEWAVKEGRALHMKGNYARIDIRSDRNPKAAEVYSAVMARELKRYDHDVRAYTEPLS